RAGPGSAEAASRSGAQAARAPPPRVALVAPGASRAACVLASGSAEGGTGSPSGTGRGGRRGRRSVAAPRGRGYGQDKDPRSSQRVQGARTVMATTTGGFSVPEAAPA